MGVVVVIAAVMVAVVVVMVAVVVVVVAVMVDVVVAVWVIVVVAAHIVFGLGFGLPPGSLVFFDLVTHCTMGTLGRAGRFEACGNVLAKAGFLQLQFDRSTKGLRPGLFA